MERDRWAGWKTTLAAGLVAALLGALLAGLLFRLIPSSVAGRAAMPLPGATCGPATTPLPGTTCGSAAKTAPPLRLPAGWTQVLPGFILSDFSHVNTLVLSAVKAGRVATCALPPQRWPISVAPVFVLSDDGGRTWQQRAIPLAGVVWECFLRNDILHPDTYAVSLIHIKDGKAGAPDETLVTHDAGRTWNREALPASIGYSCATLPQQLHMPSGVQAQPCTVDPWDPTHLYAIIPTDPSTASRGLSLYETRDGGGSWRQLHTWPTALRLMEIHPTSGGLYVLDGQDAGGKEGVYRSVDGGTTWTELPVNGAVSKVDYFGLGGRLLATAYPRLFQVDPATGEATPLGDVPVTTEGKGVVEGVISAVAISEGTEPSLVVAGPYGTYVRSLPPLR